MIKICKTWWHWNCKIEFHKCKSPISINDKDLNEIGVCNAFP